MTSKRLFDLLFVIPVLLFLLPFFILFAVWVKLDSDGPVFFRQERIGYRGRLFFIWKFRTMTKDAEKNGAQLTIGDDPRITYSGYWLRKFKIDELPQLFNVLTGDMSLVGPRPEVPMYVSLYTSEQRRILDQIPGITDPASIMYRDESKLLSQFTDAEKTYREYIMPEKIKINLQYAATATLWSDAKVILETIAVCFR